MKRLAFLAVLALVAGASCTKHEALTDKANATGSPISFEVPLVSKTATKAPIDGVTYPTTESFNVWGIYSGSALAFSSIETAFNWLNYIGTSGSTGATATHRAADVGIPEAWVPAPAAYWPKAGYLTFQAVSPATFGGVVNWAAHTITSGSYTVDATHQDDIMYSEITANKQEADYYGGANKPDDDNNSGNHTYTGVDIKFHHALAQIQFKFKKHASCNTWTPATNTGEKIEVLSITVNNAKATSAGLTVTNSTAFDGTYTVTNGALSGDADYTFSENGGGYVTVPENSQDAAQIHFNAQAGVIGALVLPQTLADDVTVDVVFRSTIGDGASGTNNVVSGTRTVSGIKLNTLAKAGPEAVTTWEPAKKYIYTLYFKENEIIFDPAVVDFDTAIQVDANTNVVNN